MKHKILMLLTLFLMGIVLVSCEYKNKENLYDNETQQLQIFKSDLNLTQDQQMSRIKAEHLKKNKGYIDSDEVITILSLSEDALIDTYNNKYSGTVNTLAKYASSIDGRNQADRIEREQNSLIKTLREKGLIDEVLYKYSTIINAVAVKTTYENFKKLEDESLVEKAILSETYNMPQTVSDTSAIENIVNVYETGIFDSSSVSYTGLKTSVAVLDSGFDCSHSVFANQPSELMITPQDVTKVLSQTRAAGFTKDLELYDVYYSNKIPFVYDYADKDNDVFPYDSEHGTHVAGIIGGKDDVITGVAINTQLVLMKVFPDLDSGAETTDILAALEDAVLLGVDAINMSLGSSCGFVREEDGSEINRVYDKINESGISLLTAASNSYSSGYGGEQGNTNFVTNPDSGTVGSPSTYAPALSVASISGTKSKYLLGNGSQVFFFNESNSVTAEPNDFFKELGIGLGQKKEYEYVTVPGVGLKVNYSGINVKGKIALVRRGDNTFEEKAANAKNAGAIACIIYNNIDGDILMSMGKTDHIPTISISKDDGTILAQKESGTIVVDYSYQAGPFMSDFSSWGPTPSLGLKPEITAHGGNIKSAVPGGGYDELSGTSMATPNLCGIVILIRQYLKEKYPTYSAKEISVLTNQLLMSTATIIKNEQGNPYSPRKQGAGLASLFNAVNTKAYITVDGSDRTKIELYDDPKRDGIYNLEFNLVNLSNEKINYDLSLVSMTESVSTSDSKHVAEKSQLLSNNFTATVDGKAVDGNVISCPANSTVKIKLVYKLSDKDKNTIESLFPYGMYVEGFAKLTAKEDDEIDLNIPFLAFYGDWTEAPMFDKTYYEVESEAHNKAIDDEDKIKADYFATTPYGSYFYNYIIPLGTYLYDVDTDKYDEIPAKEDHIAISNILGTIDGISAVYAGLLRNAKKMTFTITDKVTGEVIWEYVDNNATKSYSYGGSPIPYYENLKIKSKEQEFINNRVYEFTMKGQLDYGDGGEATNIRNSFSFDFTLDDEAPVLKDASYEKIYDKTLKKDRYYVTLTIYDNQYVQAVTPIIFNSSQSYTFLTKYPIPVYSEKGTDNKVRFEITDILEEIGNDKLMQNGLAFSIDDYALNSNIYYCQLPGTAGDFKFTKDGTTDGVDLTILSLYEDDVIDLTQYLATYDKTVDENKDYLKYLSWTSSNEDVAEVKDGIVKAIAKGRATIAAKEMMEGRQAILIINVKEKTQSNSKLNKRALKDGVTGSKATVESVRFSYFDTLFAYSRAAQTSKIGETGDRFFISGVTELSFYPGEKIQLYHDLDPWYAADKYEVTYTSTNPEVAIVDEKGVVTGLKEGNTNIVLNLKGSILKARVRITIKSEFVIENRTLIAYKGLGGNVVIPDDEGILYIGSYAFCLYETDRTIELTEDDYDKNKIPSMNTTVKSVVIPDGVEEIQKFAFYNCTGLEKVVIPDSVKFIREYAFSKDESLNDINLSNIQVIGREAFKGCENLRTVDLSKIYAIGASGFEGCTALEYADLSTLRNTGEKAFKDCTALTSVKLSENTKLAPKMFACSGLISVDIYEKIKIPEFCFAQCENLVTVTLHNNMEYIDKGAFCECPKLKNFNIKGTINQIGEQALYNTLGLETITLPNNEVILGKYCFFMCENLKEVVLQENTKLNITDGLIFDDTALAKFTCNNNKYYVAVDNLLLNKEKDTIIFAFNSENKELVIDESIKVIGASAFSGTKYDTLMIQGDVEIKDYAFAGCDELTKVVLPALKNVIIGKYAFTGCGSLESVENLDKVKVVKDYAFSQTSMKEATIGANSEYGEGAFFKSKIEKVTIGENTKFGLGAFQYCSYLTEVVMPEKGNVHFGFGCFAYAIQLSKIDLRKTDSYIEPQTFYGCSSLRAANLDNVEIIGEYAFSDCSALNYVSFPKVKEIGDGAFSRNAKSASAPIFSKVEFPATLTKIGERIFMGCQGISEIIFPEQFTKIPNYTFAYCLKLEKVVLPSNVKEIGEFAFAGCEILSKINLKDVEKIGQYAFTSCPSLENVDLTRVEEIGDAAFASTSVNKVSEDGNNVLNYLVKVGDYAFQGTNILKISAPKLESIGIAAFQNNSNLKEFVFANNIKYVGSIAFLGCDSIENFYFMDADKKVTDGKINDYALLNDGSLYTSLKSGFLQLSQVPGGKKTETLNVIENTYRIDIYAGNNNKNIKKIILPDTLKTIGNYAFYKYDNLEVVEFKSFTAPALEDSYNKNAVLTEEDPGFGLLQKYLDLFQYELYYYTFIDLAGKKNPIEMILPKNEKVEGYDALPYEAYFGKASEASRSDYEAKDKSFNTFTTLAAKVKALKVIVLTDENLINNALSALNSIKQDPTKFGYTQEEWDEMVNVVKTAKARIIEIKLQNASDTVKKLNEEVKKLPTVFEISNLTYLMDLNERINALKYEERTLLDLTNYNLLLESYGKYIESLNEEINTVNNNQNSLFTVVTAVTTAMATLGAIVVFGKFSFK